MEVIAAKLDRGKAGDVMNGMLTVGLHLLIIKVLPKIH